MVKIKTLIGSLLVLLVLGSVYAWSLFNLPLADKYSTDVGATAFTFGILTLFLAIGSSSSGFLKLKIGLQNVVALSAVCTGLGLLIAAFAPNLIVLYLSAGVLLGFGDGLGYMLVLTNCVKFFPKSKGLISALCIGAYGLGSLLFKSIDSYVLTHYTIESALLSWGIITAVATTLGCVLIYDAMQQASVVSNNQSKREYDLHSAIRTMPYWLLSIMFFIDCMVGLYVIGVSSNLGIDLLDMSLQEAATAVSVVAIANILGRLIMGALSDKLPRVRLITFDQCLSLAAMVILLVAPLTPSLFFVSLALIAFSFGGTLTIYPSIISDFFGIKNLAKNYGLLYLGFGVGSLFGYAVAYIFGSYQMTFIMMAGLLVVAIISSLMVRLPAELNESHKELVKSEKLHNKKATSETETKAADSTASETKAEEQTSNDSKDEEASDSKAKKHDSNESKDDTTSDNLNTAESTEASKESTETTQSIANEAEIAQTGDSSAAKQASASEPAIESSDTVQDAKATTESNAKA